MSVSHARDEKLETTWSAPGALLLGGGLLLIGFLVNAVQRAAFHPSGAEDDHEEIFAEYAASEAWVGTHLAEFLLVLVALAGLFIVCRALLPDARYLSTLAAGAIVVTGAIWAVLQAVDGVTLKQAVDAWVAASGADVAGRFADAESARWLEWGLQSYFRVSLGVAFLLAGAAAVVSPRLPSWLGALLMLGGLLSGALGISVGYEGLESDFQNVVALAFQAVVIVFIIGVLVVGWRARGQAARP